MKNIISGYEKKNSIFKTNVHAARPFFCENSIKAESRVGRAAVGLFCMKKVVVVKSELGKIINNNWNRKNSLHSRSFSLHRYSIIAANNGEKEKESQGRQSVDLFNDPGHKYFL